MTGDHGRRLGKGHWSDPYDGLDHPDRPDPHDVVDDYDPDEDGPQFDPELDADLGPYKPPRKFAR
jgi:hypothetical protein